MKSRWRVANSLISDNKEIADQMVLQNYGKVKENDLGIAYFTNRIEIVLTKPII